MLDADALAPNVEGMDAVLHLAAIPSPGRAPNAEIFQINTASTFNVFDACAHYGVNRVVCASSINAVGYFFGAVPFEIDYIPADEDHPKGYQERREVAVARHLHQRGARGSARRRLSLAFAGPTRVALQLAISGAGERPQPCASEHNYESYGDSVVLRDSVLQLRRAAIGRQADLRRRPHTKVASVFEPRIWSSDGSGGLDEVSVRSRKVI